MGNWPTLADAVAALGAAHVVVLNARASESSVQEVSSIVVDDRLPFGPAARRSCRRSRWLGLLPATPERSAHFQGFPATTAMTTAPARHVVVFHGPPPVERTSRWSSPAIDLARP